MPVQEIFALMFGGLQVYLLLDIRQKMGEYGVRLTNLEKRTDKLEENTNVKHLKRAASLR